MLNKDLNKISYKDITFVVQGPTELIKNGKRINKCTKDTLNSIRNYFPGATIVLSTWRGQDINNLDYDIVIYSEDPGPNFMGEVKTNCFRQIVSTQNGLKEVKTKYAFKIRTDIKFVSNRVLKYFLNYNKCNFDIKYKLLDSRVITLTSENPYKRYGRPFFKNDFITFGLTKDLVDLYAIPVVYEKKVIGKESHKTSYINPISPEQYIWVKFLQKYNSNISLGDMDDISNGNIEISERYFANNCILLNGQQAGVVWLKHKFSRFFWIVSAIHPAGIYTMNDYKILLNKYAENEIKLNSFLITADYILYKVSQFLYSLRRSWFN